MAPDAGSLLQVRNLAKTRGERDRRVQILVPALDVRKGEFVAVVGANGSGKSTLLDMLGLILSPEYADTFELCSGAGAVDLNGLSARHKLRLRRRHLAYVLQSGGLLECLTLRGNLRLAAALREKPMACVADTAELLGIADVLHQRPGRVSGGQRQKAAIARALVQGADLVLADEPTSAMDAPSAKRLMQNFRRLTSGAGSSIVMVTHDLDLATASADRVHRFRSDEAAPGLFRSVLEPHVREAA